MAQTTKIQVTLDDRLVAILGDDRSGNIKEAVIQLYDLDRTTLTRPEMIECHSLSDSEGEVRLFAADEWTYDGVTLVPR